MNIKKITSLFLLSLFIPMAFSHDLERAVTSEERDPKNAVRDSSRHPLETLSFFGIKSDMTIVELSPGGGWYTEILANFLHEPGKLIAAHFDPNSERAYYKRSRANFEKKMSANSMFDTVEMVTINSNLAEPNSVDAVLTFRNLHNWLGSDMDLIFSNSYKALKPGGLFGVVEHRAKPGTSMEVMKKSGYVSEEHAIEIAKKHGFELVAKSEINANPKDSTDHPGGVWTLPPNLRLKDEDREKYLEIGESDRMTLLFKKS
ncbi:methyltransferase domain-containing protein [Gammaproteobacteria bacterium]|jgi:predicted methyltransferase|nr:methyltransferase domain-containing protein [Gammaproteobacteria bacterium]MDA9039566.1 methyltransferase domain-containing protein [Gammaproteobacteria bacterium]MDA9102387.1 methyltransferase domain-containing protein [Gammaproteobacteria bacterium]